MCWSPTWCAWSGSGSWCGQHHHCLPTTRHGAAGDRQAAPRLLLSWPQVELPEAISLCAADVRNPAVTAWLDRNLGRIRHLVLRSDEAATGLLPRLSRATALRSLEVAQCSAMQQLPAGLVGLPHLTALVFSSWCVNNRSHTLAQHTPSCQLQAFPAELKHEVQPPQPAVTAHATSVTHASGGVCLCSSAPMLSRHALLTHVLLPSTPPVTAQPFIAEPPQRPACLVRAQVPVSRRFPKQPGRGAGQRCGADVPGAPEVARVPHAAGECLGAPCCMGVCACC